ncbi:ZN208 protein, partial [Polyodon spathula]|nr:ZN208 protein [Polyodon spathula]
FTCYVCDRAFPSSRELLTHQRGHTEERPFQCPVCGARFGRSSELTAHKRTHFGQLGYACAECGKPCKTLTLLKYHRRTHTGERPYLCPQCGKSFSHHVGQSRYVCTECGRTWKTLKRLLAHRHSHAGDRPHQCEECGHRFKRAGALQRHRRGHQTPEPHRCWDCARSFSTAFQLTEHRRLHTGERPYKCVQCGKMFCHLANYQQHLERHVGDPVHKCPSCQRVFGTELMLEKHLCSQGVQPPPGEFQCGECGQAFWRKQELKRHEDRHRRERRYKCSECGKGFRKYASMRAHLEIHSRVPLFCCPDCPERFETDSQLLRHSFQHLGVKPFTCLDCKRFFKWAGSFKKHRVSHSRVKTKVSFECPDCGEVFAHPLKFRAHKRRHGYAKRAITLHANKQTQSGEKPYKCLDCGKSYCYQTSLETHQRSHADSKDTFFRELEKLELSKSLECPECGKHFSRVAALQAHQQSHVDSRAALAKPHACECGKGFVLFGSLTTHKKSCRGADCLKSGPAGETVQAKEKKSWECQDCSETFTSTLEFRNHRRRHSALKSADSLQADLQTGSGEKRYFCPECGKSYCSLSWFQNHWRSHSDSWELDWLGEESKSSSECPECRKHFPGTAELTTHLPCQGDPEHHHECQSCGKTFASSRILKNHKQLRSKKKKRSHKCAVCSKGFLSLCGLRKHSGTHAGDPKGRPFRCKGCPKTFMTRSGFLRHWKHHCGNPVSQAAGEETALFEIAGEAAEGEQLGKDEQTASQPEEREDCSSQSLCSNERTQTSQVSKPESHKLDGDKSLERLERGEHSSRSTALHDHTHGHITAQATLEKPYMCECGRGYCSTWALTRHKKSHAGTGQLFSTRVLAKREKLCCKCRDCGKSFSYLGSLHGHRRFYGGRCAPSIRTKSFKCLDCGECLSDASQFRLHRRRHGKCSQTMKANKTPLEKPYRCPDCGKSYCFLASLETHQQTHVDTKPASTTSSFSSSWDQSGEQEPKFECPVCGERFSRGAALRAHQQCHLEDQATLDKPYLCQCGKGYSSSRALGQHRKTAHPDLKPPQSCGERRSGFSSGVELGEHQLRRAAQAQSHECQRCGKSFGSLPKLRAHERLRSKKRQLCPRRSCGYEEEGQLKRHVAASHKQGGRPVHHKCGDCNVGFLSLSDLRDHVKNHAAKKPFKCKGCPKMFVSRSGFLRHWKRHCGKAETRAEGGAPRETVKEEAQMSETLKQGEPEPSDKEEASEEPSGEKPCACPVCRKRFCTPAFLEYHRRLAHADSRPPKSLLHQLDTLQKKSFKCPECGKRFSRASAFHSHLRCHTDYDSCQDVQEGSTSAAEEEEEASRSVCLSPSEPETEVEPKKNPFECPECGQCFSCSKALLTHQHWHTRGSLQIFIGGSPTQSEKPYQCDECGKGYCSVKAFHNHLWKHMDRKPLKSLSYQLAGLEKNSFECPQCGMRFSRASALQSHKQSHLNARFKSRSSSEKPFKCAECGRGYWSPAALSVHQKSQHASAKPSLDPCQGREKSDAEVSSNTPDQSDASGKGNATHWGEKPYRCDECGKGCDSIKAVHNHQRKHRKPLKSLSYQLARLERNSFECPECGMRFSRASALQSHNRNHLDSYSRSSKDKPYRCTECKKSYWSLRSLYTHKKCHLKEALKAEDSNQKPYPCPDCEKSYSSAGALHNHKKSGHKKPGNSVDSQETAPSHKRDCVTSYELKPDIKSEVEIEPETELEPKKDPFKCPECGQCFSCSKALLTHQHWHTRGSLQIFIGGSPTQSEKPYQCDECGKGYCSIKAFCDHLRKHMVRKPLKSLSYQLAGLEKNSFECPECGMRFSRASALQSHKQNHLDSHSRSSKDKPCRCTECEKSFWSLRSLYAHKKCHVKEALKEEDSNQKPYPCPDCEKSYSSAGALHNHKKSGHKKPGNSVDSQETAPRSRRRRPHRFTNRSYQCQDCGKRYSTKSALYNHKKSHIAASVPDLQGAPQQNDMPFGRGAELWKCQKCGKSFTTSSLLNAHRKQAWNSRYTCSLCCKGFPEEGELLQHMQRGHECRVCGMLFRALAELRLHLETHPGARPFRCLTCGLAFSHLKNLTRHQKNRSHQGVIREGKPMATPKRHKCPQCGKAFRFLSEVKRHQPVHTREKQQCQLCPKAYSLTQGLRVHQRS